MRFPAFRVKQIKCQALAGIMSQAASTGAGRAPPAPPGAPDPSREASPQLPTPPSTTGAPPGPPRSPRGTGRLWESFKQTGTASLSSPQCPRRPRSHSRSGRRKSQHLYCQVSSVSVDKCMSWIPLTWCAHSIQSATAAYGQQCFKVITYIDLLGERVACLCCNGPCMPLGCISQHGASTELPPWHELASRPAV